MTNELMSLDNSIQPVRDTAGDYSKALAFAEIQSGLVIAQKAPRDEARAVSKIMISLDRIAFAKKATYLFPRGKSQIKGPSVNLAREFGRHWGNLRYGVNVIHDDEKDRTVEGWAWDLETNTRISGQSSFKKVHQRKNPTTQRTEWVEVDERDLRELTNKHGALCVRNSLLQLFPPDIIEGCVAKAFKIVAAGVDGKNIISERAAMLANFSKNYQIAQPDLEDYLEVDCSRWGADELAMLTGLLKSLEDGQVKRDDIIVKQKKDAPADLEAMVGAVTPKATTEVKKD